MKNTALVTVSLTLVLGASGCAQLARFERSLEEAGIARFAASEREDGRSVAVRADLTPGTSVGRAAVVGPSSVLTVAHVVGARSSAWVATRDGGGWVEARVVRRIPATPEPLVLLELDVDDGVYGAFLGFTGFADEDAYRQEPGGLPTQVVTPRGVYAWGPGVLRPGDSGSPVLDRTGALVGCVSARRGDEGVVSFLPAPGPTGPSLARR